MSVGLPTDVAAVTAAPPGVPSPCVNVCRMDAARIWCEGCLRSIDEIAGWSKLADEAKRAIWLKIDARRAALDAPSAARAEPLRKDAP